MRTSALAAAACLATCVFAAELRAELYQWTDEHGQVHVTDDATKVPTGQSITYDPARTRSRPASTRAAASAATPASAAPSSALTVEHLPAPVEEGRTHVLHFQRAGHEISLDVTLDERVVCNFKADTGASLNTLPRWAADELGIEIDADTPVISVVGVSGQAMRVPVVTIASLRVGTLYAENIEMAVLDTMSSGLLGMPFFNRYRVAIDPNEGELRLTEVDLDKLEGIYAGIGEEVWRKRFRALNQQLAALQKAREAVPSENETAAQNYLERIDREEAKLQRQLDELEDRAQAAGVPARLR